MNLLSQLPETTVLIMKRIIHFHDFGPDLITVRLLFCSVLPPFRSPAFCLLWISNDLWMSSIKGRSKNIISRRDHPWLV
jgi:hypothetical protein